MLDGPERDALVRELTRLFDYPKTTALLRRGGRYFFTDNPGLLNQPVLHARDGELTRMLLDPNALSAEGTTALTAIAPSPDGRLVAYALSEDGSDRQVIRVRDAETAVDRDDALRHVKFASIAWARDGSGFYYLRFPEPGSVPPEDAQYFGRIHFHRLGDPQAADPLIFETTDRKEVVPMVHVTADGRWVVITAQRGASDDSEVYLIDQEAGPTPRPMFTGFDAAYDFIEAANRRLFFRTTKMRRAAASSRSIQTTSPPARGRWSPNRRIGSRARSWRATPWSRPITECQRSAADFRPRRISAW